MYFKWCTLQILYFRCNVTMKVNDAWHAFCAAAANGKFNEHEYVITSIHINK